MERCLRGCLTDDSGERLNGIQEVSGSIPLISTKNDRIYEVFRESCHFFIPFRSCPFRSIINVLLTQIRQRPGNNPRPPA